MNLTGKLLVGLSAVVVVIGLGFYVLRHDYGHIENLGVYEKKDPLEKSAGEKIVNNGASALGSVMVHENVYDLIRSGKPKDEIIAQLKQNLKSGKVRDRMRAAEFLLALGERAGSKVLLEILADESADSRYRILSAGLLERYGVVMPFDILKDLYDSSGQSELIEYMAMQGLPEANDLVLRLLETGGAGGSFYFLAFTDKSTSAKEFALATVKNAKGAELAEVSLYLAIAAGDDNYMKSFLVSLGRKMDDFKNAFPGRQSFDNDQLRLMLGIKSDDIRDFFQIKLSSGDQDVATSSLVALYSVQKDYDFIDRVISERLKTEDPSLGLDKSAFWRVVARRSIYSSEINALARARATKEVASVYFGLDVNFVDDYWVIKYLPYRPLVYRH